MGLTILAVLINSNTMSIKINTGSINHVIFKEIYFCEVGSAGTKKPAQWRALSLNELLLYLYLSIHSKWLNKNLILEWSTKC